MRGLLPTTHAVWPTPQSRPLPFLHKSCYGIYSKFAGFFFASSIQTTTFYCCSNDIPRHEHIIQLPMHVPMGPCLLYTHFQNTFLGYHITSHGLGHALLCTRGGCTWTIRETFDQQLGAKTAAPFNIELTSRTLKHVSACKPTTVAERTTRVVICLSKSPTFKQMYQHGDHGKPSLATEMSTGNKPNSQPSPIYRS